MLTVSFPSGYGFGWAPAFSLTTSEICPTRTRGLIVTIAFAYQNLLNFGITRAFPNMTITMHAYGPFALFAAFTFVGIIWVFLAFPECKGRSVENTASLFNLPWYKVGRHSVRRDAQPEIFEEGGADDSSSMDKEKNDAIVERVDKV